MPYVIYDVYNIHLIGGITIKMMQWEGLPREERFPFVYKKVRPDTILNIRDYNGNIHMVSRKNTYAVLSLQNGDDVKTVQTNLGHASAAFTLDVYGHVSDRMQRESSDRMENYIKSLTAVQ